MQRKIRYNKAEVITMEKTMTLNLRVNPTVKQQAEDVLKQLGIPMATAIDMYLRQITLTGGRHTGAAASALRAAGRGGSRPADGAV